MIVICRLSSKMKRRIAFQPQWQLQLQWQKGKKSCNTRKRVSTNIILAVFTTSSFTAAMNANENVNQNRFQKLLLWSAFCTAGHQGTLLHKNSPYSNWWVRAAAVETMVMLACVACMWFVRFESWISRISQAKPCAGKSWINFRILSTWAIVKNINSYQCPKKIRN